MAERDVSKGLTRRDFVKAVGALGATAVGGALAGCAPGQAGTEATQGPIPPPTRGPEQNLPPTQSPEPTKQSEPTKFPTDIATVEPPAAVESFNFGGTAELLDDPLGGPKVQKNILSGDGTAVIDRTGYIVPKGFRVDKASVDEGLVRFTNGLLERTILRHREGLFPHFDKDISEKYPFGFVGWVDKKGKEVEREDPFINPQKGEQVKFNPDTMTYVFTDPKGNERIEKILPASLSISAESLNVRSAPMVASENVLPGFSLKSGDWVTPIAAAFDSNNPDRGIWLKLTMTDASGKKQNVWIAASYQGQTPVETDEAFIKSLPKEDLPPAPKPEKTAEPTQEPTKEPEKIAESLYPTAFELPLQAEVEIEGEKISVDLLLKLTDNFVKETGYSKLHLAEPDRLPDMLKMVVYGAYVGWQSDNPGERANTALKDWLALVKKGNGNLKVPAVDETKPEAGIDNREVLDWVLKTDDTGRITMKAGIIYAGGRDPLPLKATSEIYTNLVMNQDRLTLVRRFIETPPWLSKNGFKYDEPITQNLVSDFFTVNLVTALRSMFFMDHQAALTHKGDLYPFDQTRDSYLGNIAKEISLPMSNNTLEDFTDDKPTIRLLK